MHIIHVTTNGMADHAYEIKWDEDLEKASSINNYDDFYGGWWKCSIPSKSLERLDADEQYALSHNVGAAGSYLAMKDAKGAEREAVIARASAKRRAALAKYIFAKETGLVDQERYELRENGAEKRLKRSWRDLRRLKCGHPVTWEQHLTQAVMSFILEKFDYTLLSCEEARSQYLEPADTPEGLYLPHPTKPDALMALVLMVSRAPFDLPTARVLRRAG